MPVYFALLVTAVSSFEFVYLTFFNLRYFRAFSLTSLPCFWICMWDLIFTILVREVRDLTKPPLCIIFLPNFNL